MIMPPQGAGRELSNQIRVARDLGLPIIVHARDADDMADILESEMGKGAFKEKVLHCFSSGQGWQNAPLLSVFISVFRVFLLLTRVKNYARLLKMSC